jgi:tetratricopeptide (TPR) repeat protein
MRNDFIKRTAEEEEKELLTTPSGQQAAEGNRQKAEQLYRDAIHINPALPDSYRGLGMLFEHTGKTQEAIDQYKEYLRLAPEALDRLRIQRRVENLEKPVLQQ